MKKVFKNLIITIGIFALALSHQTLFASAQTTYNHLRALTSNLSEISFTEFRHRIPFELETQQDPNGWAGTRSWSNLYRGGDTSASFCEIDPFSPGNNNYDCYKIPGKNGKFVVYAEDINNKRSNEIMVNVTHFPPVPSETRTSCSVSIPDDAIVFTQNKTENINDPISNSFIHLKENVTYRNRGMGNTYLVEKGATVIGQRATYYVMPGGRFVQTEFAGSYVYYVDDISASKHNTTNFIKCGSININTASSNNPQLGGVFEDSLVSSVQSESSDINSLFFSQRFSLTLFKDRIPQDWKNSWVITENDVIECEENETSQSYGLECKVADQPSGITAASPTSIVISAKNANDPFEISNGVIYAIYPPEEGDFRSCTSPPQNHKPSSCIDTYRNGLWNLNEQFSCLDGYEKSGKKCVLESTKPSFLGCTAVDWYDISNNYRIYFIDANGERCDIEDWEVRGTTYSYGRQTYNDGARELVLERKAGGTVTVSALYQNQWSPRFQFEIAEATEDVPINGITQLPLFKISADNKTSVRLPVGESITIRTKLSDPENVISNYGYSNELTLNGNLGVLECDPVVREYYPTYTCTAKKRGYTKARLMVNIPTPDQTTVVESNDIAFEVVSASTTSPQENSTQNPDASTPSDSKNTSTMPPAGYEDEVRTYYQNSENPFSDTNISSLVGISAAELYRRAVIGGFADGTFRADQPVNRAEAAKFLMLARRQNGLRGSAGANRFWDIIPGEWYYEYVMDAAMLGIINGYDDGSFKPANTIIRAEFLKMMNLAFGMEANLPYTYTDANQYPDAWFWEYAGAAQKYNLFPGRRALEPTQEVTRGEVAVAIYQFLKNRTSPSAVTITNYSTKDYQNNDYDYSFKYPEPFEITAEVNRDRNANLDGSMLHKLILNNPESSYLNTQFEITILSVPGTWDHLEYIGPTTVNGIPATEYKDDQGECTYPNCLPSNTLLVFEKNGLHYLINYDLIPENQRFYELIMNYLRFE